jgi:predicted transcriptional regulator
MPYDTELIAKSQFEEMIQQKKVLRFAGGHGGIIYEVLRILEKNASTLDGIADYLKIDRKTAYNAIAHLKQRHNKKIIRFYNPKDRKYYYYLES